MPRYEIYWEDEREKLRQIKLEVCHALRRKAERNGWSQKEFAVYMRTNETYASRILRKRVDKISLTKLFIFLARIDGGFRILIANR